MYKQWNDEAIAVSGNLSDHDKLISELYIEKMDVIPTTLDFALKDYSMKKVAAIQMASCIAIVDASIPVWIAKYSWNAVRPITSMWKTIICRAGFVIVEKVESGLEIEMKIYVLLNSNSMRVQAGTDK